MWWNLANTGQIEATEFNGYSPPTRNKLGASGHDARSTVVGVIDKLDRRRVLLTTDRLDVAKFSKLRVWGKVPEGTTLIFGSTPISLQDSLG